MKIKIFNQYKERPVIKGEVFTDESLTDQLADEPLQRIFQRYVASGQTLPLVDGDIDINADDESIESALADTALDGPSVMSKLEQQDILVTAERLVEQLRHQSVAPSENEPKSAVQASKQESASQTLTEKENAKESV